MSDIRLTIKYFVWFTALHSLPLKKCTNDEKQEQTVNVKWVPV